MLKIDEELIIPPESRKYAEELFAQCKQSLHEGKTTLFIGDSFFDTRWFCEGFYEHFAGKDVIAAGIGGATTYDWKKLAKRFFKRFKPKNLVINLGTNNFYDDRDTLPKVLANLQALFLQLNLYLPATKIFYYSIAHREDSRYSKEIDTVNAFLREWCASEDWIYFLDVVDELPPSALRDGVHPKPESYEIFWRALSTSPIELE